MAALACEIAAVALEEAGQFGRYVACVEAVMETQLRSSLSDEVHPF